MYVLGGRCDGFAAGAKMGVRGELALLRRMVVRCSAFVKWDSERRKEVRRDWPVFYQSNSLEATLRDEPWV